MTTSYVIFSVDELNKINFEEVLEDSIDTVRKSVDETQTFVKWDGTMPESVSLLETKSQTYFYEEIVAILNTAIWDERL